MTLAHHPRSSDLALLALLTGPADHLSSSRRPAIEPLIVKLAALSAQGLTRTHHLHQYSGPCQSCQSCRSCSPSPSARHLPARPVPPRLSCRPRNPKHDSFEESVDRLRDSLDKPAPPDSLKRPGPKLISVFCQAKARIPSEYGEVSLHLYSNDQDDREHLALVVNPPNHPFPLRSASLNTVWSSGETELDRVVRGAERTVIPDPASRPSSQSSIGQVPIVRIHSECFTGELIGSRRCDCGEQFSRSLEYIFSRPPHQGMVIYLRQEGRGIGLKNKLKAYNLQDLGFDTIESNKLLGFDEDLRDYHIALNILKDFNLNKIRLMTNNPKKMETFFLNKEGEGNKDSIEVVERIEMVPSQWQNQLLRAPLADAPHEEREFEQCDSSFSPSNQHPKGNRRHHPPSCELDRYLRTKVTKMS